MDGGLSSTFSHSLMAYNSVSQRFLSISDPFNITYPTAIQTSLHSGATFAKFDPSGRFVAAGRADGSARVWDLNTKSTVRWLEGHVKGVTSVECVVDS